MRSSAVGGQRGTQVIEAKGDEYVHGFDPLEIALEVGNVFDELGVRYALGGSLASSIHGFARSTLDADLIADLKSGQGVKLAARLAASFYSSPSAIEVAIESRRSFNLIHLDTMFKVDVFVVKNDDFARTSFVRSRSERLPPGESRVLVSTPEDIVLHKLVWFNEGGAVSERQWSDVLGVLRVQRGRMDSGYLELWAERLGLARWLRQALDESGGDTRARDP